MEHRGKGERTVMARNKSLWIVVLLGLMLLAAACQPPGANPEDQGAGSGGIEGQQQVQTGAASASGKPCDVQPPNMTLEQATVRFSQTEIINPWRIAQTESMKTEGTKRAGEYIATDAQSEAHKQVSDVEDMIAQGIDILILAPREFEGLAPALDAANKADVPVFLVDREARGEVCEEYISFLGSNFIDQGERAGEWLAQATDGEAVIAELEGTIGASVTNDRAEGFRNAIEDEPGDRKSTRLNSSHANISYAVFCLKKKTNLRRLRPHMASRVHKASGTAAIPSTRNSHIPSASVRLGTDATSSIRARPSSSDRSSSR